MYSDVLLASKDYSDVGECEWYWCKYFIMITYGTGIIIL